MELEVRDEAIYIDDTLWREIYKPFYVKHLKKIKRCRSIERLEEVINELEMKAAKRYSYKLLSIRGMFIKELSNKLYERKVSFKTINQIIEELGHLGYLDDQREISLYLERAARKGLGPQKIRCKLYQRLGKEGLAELSDSIEAITRSQDQHLQIQHLIEKRYGSCDLSDYKMKRKIASFLKGRGFDMELIRQMIINKNHE